MTNARFTFVPPNANASGWVLPVAGRLRLRYGSSDNPVQGVKSMKILEQSRAPNPRRVRIFLAEKGIAVPFEQVDIMKLEHRLPGFEDKNPMRQVPVLVLDDGTAIAESVAICRYFEETNPEPPLFGVGARGKAIVEMMNRRMELGLLGRVAQAFRHTHPAMAELEKPQFKDWGEANRGRVAEMLGMMDRQLAADEFVAGGRYSIADITALIAIDFMKLIKCAVPADMINVGRWHAAVAARPSAKA
jgi:glutathione S-transferase